MNSGETGPTLSFEVESAENKGRKLYLEGHIVDQEGDRHHFFCQMGPGFVVLTAPFSPEGKKMAERFMAALGPPSREPATKCGGGCRGDKGGPGLVTAYSWELEGEDEEILKGKVAAILDYDRKECP